jgi:hypothetical protein
MSTTRVTQAAALPDLTTFMPSWSESSARAGDASTAFARQTLTAGMQWLEEGAAHAEQWLAAVSGNVHRLAEAAHEAGAKTALAEDTGSLWSAELELAGSTAQMTNASLQDLWAVLIEQQAQFMKSALLRNNEMLQDLYRTMGGHGTTPPPAAPAAADNGFAPWFEWMNQATRAAFDAAASATAAAQNAVAGATAAEAAEPAAEPATTARRGKGTGRGATR